MPPLLTIDNLHGYPVGHSRDFASKRNPEKTRGVTTILILLLFVSYGATANTGGDSSFLDVSTVQSVQQLGKYVHYTSVRKNSIADKDIATLDISNVIPIKFRG
ncbi:MAG TPA: hypothetical protein VMI35_13190, partial [Puia sp.]|nr:hypothetical protein [Puia sp.]